jgi:hypothetical protein
MAARRPTPDDVSARLAERAIDAVRVLLVAFEARAPRALLDAARAHPRASYEALAEFVLDRVTALLAAPRRLPATTDTARALSLHGGSLTLTEQEFDALHAPIATLDGEAVSFATLDVAHLGAVYERLLACSLTAAPDGSLSLAPDEARRRSGSHYTPRALTELVVRDTLAPLLAATEPDDPDAILALRVCDPSMGAGAFLLEACRQLADALIERTRLRRTATPGLHEARAEVARRCIRGVDLRRHAVGLARRSLWLEVGDASLAEDFARDTLREGNALVGATHTEIEAFAPRDDDARWRAADCAVGCALSDATAARAMRAAFEAWRSEKTSSAPLDALVADHLHDAGEPFRAMHWPLAFEEVFARGGFDAIVGNPPWVSYAGRAAQPLDARLRRFYLARYASFHGYRNLQALFVERAATLVRPSGRIGLVLPSSMAELDGYGPSRAAHDRLAICDPRLTDLGEDGFLGVFQPSMVLRSTVRAAPLSHGRDAPWPIERPDVDAEAVELLARITGPLMHPSVFGERGLQTSGDDVDHLAERADATHTVALRVGADITAFRRGPPSRYADASWFGARLRAPEAWREVAVLIRQTARVPIAAVSDGAGFRNSVLAGFAREGVTAALLVAYLNSHVIRWRHYYSNRDARLGMPQVKIGHLRAIPAPPSSIVGALTELGATLSLRNEGITPEAQATLDALVAEGFGLSDSQRARIARDSVKWG